MANTVVGFSINIDGISTINDLNNAIKDTQKQVDTITKGTAEWVAASEKLGKLKAEQTAIRKAQTEYNKSLLETNENLSVYDRASAKLNRLRKEYKDLAITGATSSKEAKALKNEIDSLDKTLKGADASVGQFQRNVGNYGDALKGIGDNLGGIGTFASQAVGGVQAFGAAFKAALGPIGLIIAAIGLAITAVKAFFNSSEEGQNKFRRLQAIAKVVFDNLMDIFETLGEIIVGVFEKPVESIKALGNFIYENITNRFIGLLELIPQLGKAMSQVFSGDFAAAGKTATDALAKMTLGVANFTDKAVSGFNVANNLLIEFAKNTEREIAMQQKLSDIQDKLDVRERQILVENARLAQQTAEARFKAAQTDKYSSEERIKLLQESMATEMKQLKNQEELISTRLYLAKTKMSMDDKDKESLKEVAQLEAELINLKTQNLNETRRIQSTTSDLIKSIQTEKDVVKNFLAETAKFNQSIVDRTAKVVTDLIQNEYDKRRQAAKDNYDKEVQDIQNTIDAEKKANEEKLKEVKLKFGEQSKEAKDFQDAITTVEKTYIVDLDKFKTEREKQLAKELTQITKDQLQAQKDLQAKALENNLKLEQETANVLIQQKQIQFNKETALLDNNKKEDADKILKLEQQLNQDIYNITKNRLIDEQELIQNELNNNKTLTQKEQEDLKNRLVALKNEETKNFTDNEQKKRDAVEETSKDEEEKLLKQLQRAADFAKMAIDTLNGFADAADQRRLDRLAKDEEANKQIEANLNERLQRASGLERRYLEQQLQENKKNAENIAKEKERIEKEAAKRRKATAIIESIINTALSVTRAYFESGPIGALIAGIAGAAQTAVIAAQPLAKGGVVGKGDEIVQFANGGKVTSRGNIKPLSNGDNVLATLKTGEIVLNESQQRRIGYASLKKAQIPNFASGGFVGSPTSLIANSNNSLASEQMRVNLMDEMINATNNRIDRLSVVYTATTDYEVEKGRNDKKTIKANSTF